MTNTDATRTIEEVAKNPVGHTGTFPTPTPTEESPKKTTTQTEPEQDRPAPYPPPPPSHIASEAWTVGLSLAERWSALPVAARAAIQSLMGWNGNGD